LSALNASINERSYRPDIDGIRAIAILSVILCHARAPWITGGFTGVDIFFVISGYLIGGHIFSDLLAGKFSFLQFYRLRAKRILPAFYAVLAFTILAALLLLSPYEASQFANSGFAATLSVSNIYFLRSAGNYFATGNELLPLLMTWSLGVEEQFYAVIPILMVLLARIRRGYILPAVFAVCVLSFFLAWFELGRNQHATFFLLPTRA
jgi:peptidoglycan/LPS O-acetylase OafA/YrhL